MEESCESPKENPDTGFMLKVISEKNDEIHAEV